ncbi:MAG: hypothetical protein P9M14_05500 [Candidatus Alcyoniella australis]|nr:hypothetical protein [Candidatus Alcyoniella australis]
MGDESVDYRWTVLPIASQPGKAVLFVLCLLAVFWTVWALGNSVYWGIFGALVVAIGVREFFMPVVFTLDEHGVRSRLLFFERSVAWSSIKRIYPERRGVFLSPFARRSRLENFRGFFLRWAAHTPREEVLRFIRQRIETTGQAPTSETRETE